AGFFFQAEDGIRDRNVTGVQTCALPIYLLGAFGDARETGKPIGGDVRARKRTAPIVEARERASIDDRRRLDRILNEKNRPSEDEIGRASCRERGEMSVEGVALRQRSIGK